MLPCGRLNFHIQIRFEHLLATSSQAYINYGKYMHMENKEKYVHANLVHIHKKINLKIQSNAQIAHLLREEELK
jgi:hypothetical protein